MLQIFRLTTRNRVIDAGEGSLSYENGKAFYTRRIERYHTLAESQWCLRPDFQLLHVSSHILRNMTVSHMAARVGHGQALHTYIYTTSYLTGLCSW